MSKFFSDIILKVLGVFAIFFTGKASGRKDAKIDAQGAENKLRRKYEEIDTAPDVANPFDKL